MSKEKGLGIPQNTLVRIVRMQFRKEYVADFQQMFQETQPYIQAFPGCLFVELRTEVSSGKWVTLSIWESEAALESYRQSELFRSTWRKTKSWFEAPAEAFSLVQTD